MHDCLKDFLCFFRGNDDLCTFWVVLKLHVKMMVEVC
jgi:hypothetical protein